MERKLCRFSGLPVITKGGKCGMACESTKKNPPPSGLIEAKALILPRVVRLCGDSVENPCTDHEPTNRIEYDVRIGW